MDDFWVFGYGSLMWNPGFDYVERHAARLYGFHRSLCVRSQVYRGTPAAPGLVMGLDHGGSCRGMAFRVEAALAEKARTYLRDRELVTHVYLERRLPLTLDDGRRVNAMTFVVDRGHPQYAGHLPVEEAAAIVHRSVGQAGPNSVYVQNTLDHMRAIGVRDRWMEAVARRVSGIGGSSQASA